METPNAINREYRVIWEVDVVADSPEGAARAAADIQRQQTSALHTGVFDVWDEDGKMTHVDLLEELEDEDSPVPATAFEALEVESEP